MHGINRNDVARKKGETNYGKGSAPRDNADNEKYRNNFDNIFKKNSEVKKDV